MSIPLALIVSSYGIGGLLLLLVGVIIASAIVYAILRACDAPPLLYKIAIVVGLVILLLVTIDVFFGGGPVIVGPR